MERLTLKFKDAENALGTLEEILKLHGLTTVESLFSLRRKSAEAPKFRGEGGLKEAFSVIVRDAAIQRFEYTFEAFWKLVKEYLKEKEGVVGNAPKACFRELFSLGICSEEETVCLQEMTDRRNDTSHTYKEEVAQRIYSQIQEFYDLMLEILRRLKTKTGEIL